MIALPPLAEQKRIVERVEDDFRFCKIHHFVKGRWFIMILTIKSKIKDNENNIYILDEALGNGGFGTVYKAHKEADKSIVAVKTLLSTFNNKEELLSFQKEIAQTTLVSSPNVIKYYCVHDGTQYESLPPYIIMEYANQGTLRDLIDRQKSTSEMFDLDYLIGLYRQLLNGMKAVNEKLVHRDIKPENILIKDNILKISDFGLSKFVNDATRTLTFKGFGTPKYIAPEAWNNDKNTIQMDIYSMGVIFYELATLDYPYQIDNNPNCYEDAHLYKVPKNPSDINSELPPNITSIILRMLEKPTQKRFTNWNEIESVLDEMAINSDAHNSILQKALKRRNDEDIRIQEAEAKRKKLEEERKNHCKLIRSQYDSYVFSPIQEFINEFNINYVGNRCFKSIRQIPNERSFSYFENQLLEMKFNFEIDTPNGDIISIKTEIIFEENYISRVMRNDYGRAISVTESRIPEYKGKKILAWSQVSDKKSRGFNLLLVERENELYGDWYILENRNSAFGHERRPEPFGFLLRELPREINCISAMHIYTTKVLELESSYIQNFLAEHA